MLGPKSKSCRINLRYPKTAENGIGLRSPDVFSCSLDPTGFYPALSIVAHVPRMLDQILNLEDTGECV